MLQRLSVLLLLAATVTGCGPSAKEKYDEAVRELEKAEATLDSMLPAYQAAQQLAANEVCREIAGATPEESMTAASANIGDLLNQVATPPPADTKTGDEPKKVAAGRKGDELDQTIDGLIAAQKNVAEKQAALAAPIAKAQEVMKNIKTPGTPEAKKYEEKLAGMREVKAFQRQEKRVKRAQEQVDELEKELPGSADKDSAK